MTTETNRFETQPRTILGKKLRALRRSGLTPLHLYGRDLQPMSLQAETRQLERLVTTVGANAPVYVTVTGAQDTHFTFIREVQRHPLSDQILHVDFYEVSLTETMEADVPIRLVGEAPAVRTVHGILIHALQSITVESLPLDIPQYVEVDISSLTDLEKMITVRDLNLGSRVKVLTRPEEMIARVSPPRVAEEAEAAPSAAEPEVVTGRKAAEEEAPEG